MDWLWWIDARITDNTSCCDKFLNRIFSERKHKMPNQTAVIVIFIFIQVMTRHNSNFE